MRKLSDAGVETNRPNDYFAEMAKKDDHMKKVGDKLLALKNRQEMTERNRNNFKLRKYGKQVQRAVTLERQMKKKETLNSIKKYRKGKTTNPDFLDETSKENGPHGKKVSQFQKLQKQNVKRNYRDQKYGFGGKKKGQKRNTNESSNNVSGFKKNVHGAKVDRDYVNFNWCKYKSEG
uniref:probable rRNA-processing protein EBP2 isoform X2 n=1 Tax=Ciona intestinalis TaxID=7719 RepID=UPI000EF50A83|nr:probable rRNA-processing protein EBP2 isoform X2 [Ciona intestinalis]|eukprot:XP_026691444.1 probable rRNA-processing protein EBP2 isoform X2 [Ciona intestinalis]